MAWWPAYPGATGGKRVTFDQRVIERFVANAKDESFTALGTTLAPDFIYIEDNLD